MTICWAAGHLGRGHRVLVRNEAGELPEVHDAHRFVGVTEAGFVDFDTASIVPPSTINSDDYLECVSFQRPPKNSRAPSRAPPAHLPL